jgi:exodeoxyribonuclease V gamma subunit
VTLHLHRAERTDVLADELGRLLATPLPDPFAEEVVAVPAKGVERWLSQRLSHKLGASDGRDDGVCAGVRFLNPHSLISLILGLDHEDPWAPDRVVWPLLGVIDASLGESWCTTLSDHLGHGMAGDEGELRRSRRYSVARRLAGLFTSYAVQRPGLVRAWREGGDGGVAADLAWQPELYRRLLAAVSATAPDVRQTETVQRLRDGDPTLDLPGRLSLFGHTRLPSAEIELLQALAHHRDLHVWLPHPSAALWDTLSGGAGVVARRDDTGHRAVAHPLLATLSRDVRELQRSLTTTESVDHHHLAPAPPATLLGWLQQDLRSNAVGCGRNLQPHDRSIQVHSCHGAARQIDVLRDVLLGLLQDDPTLEPRDILVMCPDIETYAPLITAAFGLGEVAPGGHPAHRLRVRLADRALTQTNPLLGVVADLLALAESRATASQVLDLAESPPVRRRFGFTDDDLDSITAWVRESGVRWAFDQDHRAPYGLEAYLNNTWAFGVDRVLVGVALSNDSQTWLGRTLPLDDVGSNRVELAGRFAEYVDRLRRVTDRLTGTRPLTDWLDALADGIAELTAVERDEGWQAGQLSRELGDVLAGAADRDLELRLSDVRALLGGHLAGRPTRANFRTGTLTVCTMVPMRSVPHRVVCLVGVDDGVFPRISMLDGDDVLAREPLTGERDIRSEDRQLLLDAIGATTETLVITYTGADEHTGQPRPPAVPLGELLDALDLTTDAPVRKRVVVEHPLQPFDPRNVTPGKLGVETSFTFDPVSLMAAEAAAGERPVAPAFLAQPLVERAPDDVALADLIAFFKDPVKGFFRALDVTLPWEVDGVADAMPVEIDALEAWGVGDRMLRDMLRGTHPNDALQAEWRRGALPPGRLGWRKAEEIREAAMQLAIAAMSHQQTTPQTYDVDVDLGGGRRLTGTVGPVYAGRLVAVGYSKLDGKHLLDSWLRLLAVAAHDPDHNYSALTVGRPPRGTKAQQRLLGPVDEAPDVLLADLVAIYDAGRREPLPLPLKTSFAWANARKVGSDPVEAALDKWKTKGTWDKDDAEPAHVRVWGEHAPLSALLTPLRPGEEVEGEDTRLGAYAARLWGPLLRCERGVV